VSLRGDALSIFRAGLAAADPYDAVCRALSRLSARRVWVVGAGKASARMAQAAEKMLGARIAGGWINTKDGHGAKLRRIRLHEASHPVPDQRGVDGAVQIAEIALAAGPGDTLLCLISGGASALMPLPAHGVTLETKQETTRRLLACGANIHEINCVRKHLSAIKGGHLARLAAPANVVSLILSDVIGDNLDVIGSGPTAPDSSTVAQARAILAKYGIADPLPGIETPKPTDPLFARVKNIIVGSNRLAARAAAVEAKSLGYRTAILSTSIEGETRDVALMHAAIAREIRESGQPLRPPACLISGGETTVTIRGSGLGGRNQEFVLAAAIAIDGLKGVGILSAGTDGTDGPTDAAGAFADGEMVTKARRRGLDPGVFLEENDSYRFFDATRGLIRTGPTGTNVMDLRIVLVR
jgi:glycerate 2-kinase